MKITFKKKTPNGSDKTFEIDEGSVYVENYNETLDSATIRVSHLSEQLNIEPFDKVVLTDDDERFSDKYMCVDTYTETMESLDPYIYSYEISLFSETKELEGILLPNRSITKLSSGSRTIYTYLTRFLDLYGEKIRVKDKIIDEFYQTEQKNYVGGVSWTQGQLALSFPFDPLRVVEVSDVQFVENGVFRNIQWIYLPALSGQNIVISFECMGVCSIKGNVYFKYKEPQTIENKYKFADRVESKFSTPCPEMQWNTPTLREVITDLMMVKDCIPIVRNNVIDYIDLTKRKSDISKNAHINYIQRSQSSEDYVSELKMNLINGMQQSVKNTRTISNVCQWATFRNESNGYLIDSNNFCVRTQYPILNVKKCIMYFQEIRSIAENADDGNRWEYREYSKDLCGFNVTKNGHTHNVRLLYEKTEYDVLPIERWADEAEDFEGEITQNKAVYYERGNNIISGFTTATKKAYSWGANTNTVLWLRKIIAKYDDYGGSGVYPYDLYVEPSSSNKTNLYYSTWFYIEYETLADCVFTAGKDLPTSHNRVVADNQTNSYVDVQNQGFMEYQKVNRLGNQQLFISARNVDDYSNLLKIGDYYNDSVVYQAQYKIYKDHIDVYAIATKDYILRDYFTGVKARVRSWRIASGSDALTRHELEKYYLEFDEVRRTEWKTLNYTLSYDFLEPLNNFYNATNADYYLSYALFYTREELVNYYPSNASSGDRYCVELISRVIGNSLVFTFGADDNFEFSKRNRSNITSSKIIHSNGSYPYKVSATYTDDYGGFPLEPLRYVDDNGECYQVGWCLSHNISVPSTINDDFILTSFKRPLVSNSEIVTKEFEDTKIVYKDNKEIFKMSVQFEVCSRTHNIVFTKKFLELQKYIKTTSYSVARYKVYYKVSDTYNFRDTSLPNTSVSIPITNDNQIVLTQLDNLSTKIELPNLPFGVSSWSNITLYVTDNSDNVLLMVRGTRTLYLNVLKSRNIEVYDTNGEIIDTI